MIRYLLLLTLVLLLAGCGTENDEFVVGGNPNPSPLTPSPQASLVPGPSASPTPFPSPSLSPSPSPTPAAGVVIVRFVLLRAVPKFVQTVRVTFVDGQGTVVQGPTTQAKTAELTFPNVPTRTAQIQIDYLIGTTVIGIYRGPIAFNGTAGPIIVNDPDFVDADTLQAVVLDPPQPRLPLGRSTQFTAAGRFADGKSYDLSNSVVWTSSNVSAATITNTGLANTVATGVSTIRATVNNVTGSANLTVLNATITSLVINPSSVTGLPALNSRQLQAIGTFSDRTTKNLTNQCNWRSSNLNVADITEEGTLTAVASGNAFVNATLGSLTANCTIGVVGPDVFNITVEPANLTLNRLATFQLKATARFSDFTFRDVTNNVTWTSSIPSLGAVNSATGLVRALFPGMCRIKASIGAAPPAFCDLTVNDNFGPVPSPGASPPGPTPSPRRFDFGTGVSPSGLAAADLNRDGRPDIAVTELDGSSANGTTSVFLATGPAAFAPRVNYGVGAQPLNLAAGNIRTGQAPDLLVANAYDGDIQTLFNNNAGAFPTNDTTPGLGCDPFSVVVGDFNRDGFQDAAVSLASSFEVEILLGNGTGNFTFGEFFPTGILPSGMAVGDFDGRNGPDIAVANAAGSTVTIALNDGTGKFATTELPVGDGSFQDVVTGDFNKDGRLDLAVVDLYDNQVYILRGDGAGNFAESGLYPVGSCPTSIALGDFDGDGNLDLVTANSISDNASVLLGLGNGNFTAGGTYDVGRSPFKVATADFDGDGRADFVTTNADEDTITLWTGVR